MKLTKVCWALVLFQFATIGKVSGLGNITQTPSSGWADKVSVNPEYGYAARCAGTNPSGSTTPIFVRIYVVRNLIGASSSGVIGAEIKYQSPFNP